MAIYRLSDLVGNTNTITLLRRGAAKKRIRNVIFLNGRMGTGKSSAARAVALTLLCNSHENGEACLKCDTCKRQMAAFETNGYSINVVVKNIPALMIDNPGKNMLTLMREIFELLQNTTSVNIYILEEVHAFSKEDQTVFLEYINSMSPNTFIIMTTTHMHHLIPTLVSRGHSYPFVSLTSQESAHLLDRTCKELRVSLDEQTQTLLIRNSKGVARDLIKLVEFIKDTDATEEEVAAHLGYISNKVFIDLLQSMTTSMRSFVVSVNNLVETHSIDTLIQQFKSFMLNAAYWVEDEKGAYLSDDEGKLLTSFMSDNTIYKVGLALEKSHPTMLTEEDFRLFLLRVRTMVQGKAESSIIKDSRPDAVKERIQAQSASKIEKELLLRSEGEVSEQKLTLEGLKHFNKEG